MKASNQTPAPQELRIDMEDYTLLIPDASKPVWFGPYRDSKLGIFEAKLVNVKPELAATYASSVTYICTMVETPHGKDFIFYGHYDRGTPVNEICAHLQAVVYTEYIKHLSAADTSSIYLAGPETLQ